MKREAGGPILSAIFVDYDNIYLSLKRKSEEAAKRFSKDAAGWLRGLETGRLISETNGQIGEARRRIVMNRCYGNPVPRRNQSDNSTDMNSFPFVRHHFLRAGFEVVDCPPLTAQMKNSADIRMVMDMRDYLTHATYFDEFIILSGDADFTPVLHRLRQHARRTIVYANDHTAAPYTAICDGEVREADLIQLLLTDAATDVAAVTSLQPQQVAAAPAPAQIRLDDIRAMIVAEVVASVRASPAPVPLEALADRAIRAIGHDRTVATSWAGAGSFRELLRQALPADVRLSESPPFFAYDPARHLIQQPQSYEPAALPPADYGHAPEPAYQPAYQEPAAYDPRSQPALRGATLRQPQLAPTPAAPMHDMAPQPPAQMFRTAQPAPMPAPTQPRHQPADPQARAAPVAMQPVAATPLAPQMARNDGASASQKSITRIYEASHVPPMPPADYRALFEAMSEEINANGLAGAQTLTAIAERAAARGLSARRDDIRTVLEVISEADPWFEQGASPNLFAGRFRNFVVARCRDQGLQLSADELDLIDAWFASGPAAIPAPRGAAAQPLMPATRQVAPQQATAATPEARNGRWWAAEPAQTRQPASAGGETDDDFPRIVRTRRG